jgi:hypothetical protein
MGKIDKTHESHRDRQTHGDDKQNHRIGQAIKYDADNDVAKLTHAGTSKSGLCQE